MAEYDCPRGEFDNNFFLADTRKAISEFSVVEETSIGSRLVLTSYDAMVSHVHVYEDKHPLFVLTLLDFSFDLHKTINHKVYRIEDEEDEDIRPLFEPSIEFINKGPAVPNATVIVHCYAGISRSSSIVLAYLMSEKKMSLMNAHTHLKSKRRIIEPNDGFWSMLEDYESELQD